MVPHQLMGRWLVIARRPRLGRPFYDSEIGGGGSGPQNVTWTNVVNASAAGNNLTQTGGGLWEAGALSVQTINSGDGYMEFTVNSNSSNTMCGLGHGDPNTSYYNIDFAFYLASGALKVVENG